MLEIRMASLFPPRELVSVEECPKPECKFSSFLVTALLIADPPWRASVERCFQWAFTGTSLDGGKLRPWRVVVISGGLVLNIARRGQAPHVARDLFSSLTSHHSAVAGARLARA